MVRISCASVKSKWHPCIGLGNAGIKRHTPFNWLLLKGIWLPIMMTDNAINIRTRLKNYLAANRRQTYYIQNGHKCSNSIANGVM